jgi:hypothetical protein
MLRPGGNLFIILASNDYAAASCKLLSAINEFSPFDSVSSDSAAAGFFQ